MDYDDSDGQCHNLQLAGEERPKPSPLLRPYAFPKFDFDDSLPGHLRFDSLVESEVFLGIQSQEDQWIEDFSRASNGIEFSSSPSESCSISRRNNVWSEATSSESVEMLLKSVGQEEVVAGETLVEESNDCDELGRLTKQMDHNDKTDDNKDEPVTNPIVSASQGGFLETFHGLVEGRELQVEATSQFQGNTPSMEENLFLSDEYEDSSGKAATFSPNDSKFPVYKATEEDSYGSARLVDNFNNTAGMLSTTDMLSASATGKQAGNLRLESAGGPSEDITCEQKQNTSSREAQIEVLSLQQNTGDSESHMHNSPQLVSNDECKSQVALETNPDSAEEVADKMAKAERQLQRMQRSDGTVSCTNSEQHGIVDIEPLSASRETSHPFRASHNGSGPDDDLEQHASQFISGNTGDSVCSALKIDSVTQLDQRQHDTHLDDIAESSPAADIEVSVNTSQPALFSGEESQLSIRMAGNSSNSPEFVSSDLAALSSSLMPNNGGIVHENVESCLAASTAEMELSSGNVHCQVNEEKSVVRKSDASGSEEDDSAVKDKQNCCTELPPDARNVDAEDAETVKLDQKIGSLVAGGSSINVGVVVHGLQPVIAAMVDPEKEVSSSGKNLNPAVINNCVVESGQPSGTRPSHLDEGNEIVREISTDSLKVFGSEATKVDDTAQIGVIDEGAGTFLPCSAGKSSSIETYTDTSRSEPVSVMTSDLSQHNSKESDAHPSHEQVYKEADTGAVFAASHDESLTKAESESASDQPSDQKAACDSPTIISSQELCENDRGNPEEGVINPSVGEDPGGKIPSDDSSFTFKVISLPPIPERENGSNWSPVPSIELSNLSMVVGRSTHGAATITTPGRSRNSFDAGRKPPRSASERKSRQGSSKGASKESKINQVETTPQKSTGKGDTFSDVPLRPFGGSTPAKFGEMQSYGRIEMNNTKFSGSVAIPTSSLPDLNSSTSNNSAIPATAFHQRFTDMQQVQLRAQIFVYGSLIQGTAPDESCMTAAFGPSDGGKSAWESVWRAAVERIASQKCQSSGAETPLQSHSRVHDSAAKQVSQQSMLLPSPVSRASGKASPATVVNPTIPLSSPLWTMLTPARSISQPSGLQRGPMMDFQPVVSPLQPYQSPPMRNLAAPVSWPSQSPFPATWVSAARASMSDASAIVAPLSITETVNLTPSSNPSRASAPGMKHVTSSPPVHVVAPTTLFSGVSPLLETTKGTVSAEQYSAEVKPKKRKKVPALNDLDDISVLSETQTEQVVASSIMTPTSLFVLSETRREPLGASSVMPPTSSLVTVTTPAFFIPKTDVNKPSVEVVPISSVEQVRKVDLDTRMMVSCSEETLSKVAEAKLQAEKAASLAANAVSHSQALWSQLAKQRELGLTSEVEARLASAAVAIAAAASVAKVAAAAAEIASNAALQARLMADEAMLSVKYSDGSSFRDVPNLGNATPASILKADGESTELSTSILVAAKEAAKRRLEAASAASKQAENLDAIVKAAELAAEAVSQAGQIVAMGDPLSLSKLMRAGPDQYWKLSSASPELALKMNNKNGGESAENGEDASLMAFGHEMPHERSVMETTQGKETSTRTSSNDMLDDNSRLINGCELSTLVDEQGLDRLKSDKAVQVAKSVEVLPQLETGSKDEAFENQDDGEMHISYENTIKEGCMVEVLKDGDGFKPGWFAATVLTLEVGKAFVSYEDLVTEDGSENLKEWVSLEGDGDQAPRIRLPYPWSSLQLQGAKKRRRADMVDYAWAVGDKVDAFINHCWCQGLLTEKNEKDETALTVHFPARGETAVVRAWQLRPSRLWSDGKWVELPSSAKHKHPHLGDTPKEKRQKLWTPCIDSQGTDKLSDGTNQDSGKPKLSNPLALASSDKVFNAGRSSTEENKHAHRTLRTGLQKEGSTIYGLPKNGKKQKFVEVSKHFPADRNRKTNEVNDPTKLSKNLMPQATISRGWRNASRFDHKEKQAAESKIKAPGIRKPHSISSRTMPRRDHVVNPALAMRDETVAVDGTDAEDPVDDKNVSDKSALVELDSSSIIEGAAEGPLTSVLADQLDGSSKKVASSNSYPERLTKRKFTPSSGRLTKIDEGKAFNGNAAKSVTDVAEPRRSNRRIQPTHRLLEGLQSSMMISKMPTISHEKGPRTQSKSSSNRGTGR
ncbi:hypothetical protein Dimus_034889 [Dionaea muscipula]